MTTAAPATAIRGELRGVLESRISTGPQFELREIANGTGGTNLRFTGFASTTGTEYEMEDPWGVFIESVSVGAFAKTLSQGCDTAFLLNHSGLTLARTKSGTLKLSEVTQASASPVYGVTGLHSEALLDPANPQVQVMRSAVDRGDLDEMSFAFRVVRNEWSENFDRRTIQEVSLDKGDVSLVNFAANPHTGGTVTMRQRFTGNRASRAVSEPCNRCTGEGEIILQGNRIPCPQCGGSGTGEMNAETKSRGLFVERNAGRALRYPVVHDFRADRARLEALRYPPRREV